MRIKVDISTNLISCGGTVIPAQIELEDEKNTILNLLQKLNERFPHLKLLNNGEMGEDLRYVYVNGRSHFELPDGLNTKLNDSDSVHIEIFMEPLAGG